VLKPVSRRELIRRFHALGFEGPLSGGKHAFMRKGPFTVRIPNPHGSDIAAGLLREILRQANITPVEWNRL